MRKEGFTNKQNNDKQERRNITLRLPYIVWKRLKLLSIEKDKSLTDLITDLIIDALEQVYGKGIQPYDYEEEE